MKFILRVYVSDSPGSGKLPLTTIYMTSVTSIKFVSIVNCLKFESNVINPGRGLPPSNVAVYVKGPQIP